MISSHLGRAVSGARPRSQPLGTRKHQRGRAQSGRMIAPEQAISESEAWRGFARDGDLKAK